MQQTSSQWLCMLIRDLGEFALIARLQKRLSFPQAPHLVRGIGDDCAIVRPRAGMELLVTTDTQEEEVHFRRAWGTPQDIGWRCLAVNVSDIAAMGGTPLGAVIALSLPSDMDVAFIEALYDGLNDLALAYDCPVLGGNISRTTGHLAVTITVLGEVPQGRSFCRSGAQPGDDIWVTGDLGAAKAGLQVLLHPEAVTHLATTLPVERYLRPRPRLREAQFFQHYSTIHSMLDLSDGLSGDLTHICQASGVGATLEAARIPVAQAVQQIAMALQADALDFALNGGEDFELCFTAPPGVLTPLLEPFAEQLRCPLTRIGTIHTGNGLTLLLPDGRQQPLHARGYDHFRLDTPSSSE